MPQIFPPTADLILRLLLLGVPLLLIAAIVIWHVSLASQPRLGQPVEQPIPFSHKHHVAEVGLDCRYCHTEVERSSFAGIPPNHTCMTCHSQLFRNTPMLAPLRESIAGNGPLRWRRVHNLPDFVYFDHAIHVRQGVGCSSCHGEVERMQLTSRVKPLTMGWCLECHRAPEQYLRPRERVFDLDWQPPKNQTELGRELLVRYRIDLDRLTDCSICHR